MKGFNLSRWALEHRSFVWYLMLLFVVSGVWSYLLLGREEDPPFTVKTMIVATSWPGATIDETILQITDRIEKKLQETPSLDYLKSYTQSGQSTILVVLKESTPPAIVPDIWDKVRKKVDDIRTTLPQGIQGPFFNDGFGDTFGTIYAFTTDGFTGRELRDYVEQVRSELLAIPDAAKITLIGTRDEKIYLEFDTRQLAGLGIDSNEVVASLRAQNAVEPAGIILIDQIGRNIDTGETPWNAVVNAASHRMRPILLTAAAAMLGMLPIAGKCSGDRWPMRLSAVSPALRC